MVYEILLQLNHIKASNPRKWGQKGNIAKEEEQMNK